MTRIDLCKFTEGISLFTDLGSKASIDLLSFCQGVIPANRPDFQCNSYLSRLPWRRLNNEALTVELDSSIESATGTNWIYLWKLPHHLIDFFSLAAQAIRKHNKFSVADNVFTHPTYRRGVSELVKLLKQTGATEGMRVIGTYASATDLPSTSRGKDGKYVGLHIDSWNLKESITRRGDGYPTRLCVNIGPEDRYLQFVNMSLSQIRSGLNFKAYEDPNRLTTAYFQSYSDRPVFRLRIPFGHAYVASTDTMIHDGTTVEKSYIDAVFAILGAFTPQVARRLSEESNRTIIQNPNLRRRYLRQIHSDEVVLT